MSYKDILEAADDGTGDVNIEDVRNYIEKEGANVNMKGGEGSTLLHYAAFYGNTELANLLISKGANVNAKDNDGCTPLYDAVSGGMIGLIELLLSEGANINAKNNKGDTPLHTAAISGHNEVFHLLVSKGADDNVKNNSGCTPYYYYSNKSRSATENETNGGIKIGKIVKIAAIVIGVLVLINLCTSL